jgi:hypothetical protein
MRRYKWIGFSLTVLWPLSASAITQETFLIRYTQLVVCQPRRVTRSARGH